MSQISRKLFWHELKTICLSKTIAKTFAGICELMIANFLSRITEKAIMGQVDGVLVNVVVTLLVIVAIFAFRIAINTYINRKQIVAMQQNRMSFFEQFLANPLERLYRSNYGELLENLNNDVSSVANRYVHLYPNLISSLIILMGFVVYLLSQSAIVSFSLLLIATVQLIPPIIIRKYMQVEYEQCRKIESQITNHIVESVNGFECIKLNEASRWWQHKLTDLHKICLSVGRKADAVAATQRSLRRFVDNLLKYGTYALLGLYVALGYCDVKIAIQSIYLSPIIYSCVMSIFSTIPEWGVVKCAENRVDNWLVFEKKCSLGSSDLRAIKLDEVHYRSDDKDIIRGVNLEFQTNDNYLIVGENGSGKTTLLNLLVGFLSPTEGNIDGCPASAEREFDEHRCILIPQRDPSFGFDAKTLFAMFGSTKQNDLYVLAKRFGLTKRELEGVAIRDLSGGERKKVFLTLGFALKPQWLFLDEPTNDLDYEGKETLLKCMEERQGVIVVSHDRLILQRVNNKIVLKEGRIENE